MSTFENILLDSIDKDIVNNKLSFHLDEMLVWYSQINTVNSSKASENALKKYGELDLRLKIEEIIDKIFISSSIAHERLFPLQMSESKAKERYRKLIRVFHPDRGSNGQEWLNRRAEIINVAFEKYKVSLSNGKNKAQNAHPPSEAVHVQSKTNHLIKRSVITSSFFRKHSGEHRRYQRLIFISVISLFSMVLFLGFLSTLEFDNEPEIALNEKHNDNVSGTINIDQGSAEFESKESDVDLSMMELIGPESIEIEELLETNTVDKDIVKRVPDIKSVYSSKKQSSKDPLKKALGKERVSLSNLSIEHVDKSTLDHELNSSYKAVTNRLNNLDSKIGEKIKQQGEIVANNELASSVIEQSSLRTDYSVAEVQEVLGQYRRAFATGSVIKIMDLYTISAVHDNQRGQLKIARYFQEIFETTSSRSATLGSLLIVQDEYSQATVEGILETKMTSESQQLGWTDSQRFRIILVRDEEKLKISSFKTI